MVRASKRTFLKEKMGTSIHFPNLVARVPITHRIAFSITAVAVGNSSLYPPSCSSYLLCLLPVATTAEESDDLFTFCDQSQACSASSQGQHFHCWNCRGPQQTPPTPQPIAMSPPSSRMSTGSNDAHFLNFSPSSPAHKSLRRVKSTTFGVRPVARKISFGTISEENCEPHGATGMGLGSAFQLR